jgi:transcriptional regulator with XRE-family HTH domain
VERDYEEKYLDIGKRIAFYREKRNLSQAELAKKINCTPIYIRKIEGNNVAKKTTLSAVYAVKKLDFLFSIADALQMDVVAFFKPMTEESFQKWRRDH